MGSSKSLDLLRSAYNYKERGMKVLLMTFSRDTRNGVGYITSRTGLQEEAIALDEDCNPYRLTYEEARKGKLSAVFVDEIQFATKEQIEEFSDIVDHFKIPVLCYGLRSDFAGELFPAIEKLLVLSDTIEEIKTVCWCGSKATMNARIVDGEVTKTGEQIQIGGNESYTALCRKHWKTGTLK